jgi:hypothetical protein
MFMVLGAASISARLGVEETRMLTKLAYQVGSHTLEVTSGHQRWVAALDGVVLDRWFTSLADAWTAGVAEALRLDAGARCTFVAGADAGQQN